MLPPVSLAAVQARLMPVAPEAVAVNPEGAVGVGGGAPLVAALNAASCMIHWPEGAMPAVAA